MFSARVSPFLSFSFHYCFVFYCIYYYRVAQKVATSRVKIFAFAFYAKLLFWAVHNSRLC